MEQKGTDDEIAISNEGYMYSTDIGYFVVCPFLAACTKMTTKKTVNPDSEISLGNLVENRKSVLIASTPPGTGE